MALPNAGLTQALIIFTRLDERYQRLLREAQWRAAPELQVLIAGFQGKLTEGLSTTQLAKLEPLLLQMHDRYFGRVQNQERWGYAPRVLDVAYVVLCNEALETIERVCPDPAKK